MTDPTAFLDAISERHRLPIAVLEPRAVLDVAFVAVAFNRDTQAPIAVYDREMAAAIYAAHEKVTYREAMEWFDVNVGGLVLWVQDLTDADDA